MNRQIKIACACLCICLLLAMTPVRAQESAAPSGLTIHVVQRGENLFRIGLRYGASVDELARLNGIADPTSIQVGQRLLVPAAPGTNRFNAQHVVQAGETLASIAALYALDPPALAAANNLTADGLLFVGQALMVPAAAPPPEAPAPSAAPPAAPTAPETGAELPPLGGDARVFHIVLSGETLFQIATQYGVTVNEVVSANSLSDASLIYPGQQLLIPGVEPPRLALDLPTSVTGISIQPQVFVAGRTGMLRVGVVDGAALSGTFLGSPLTFFPDGTPTRAVSLVGLPIDSAPGVYPLELAVSAGGVSAPLAVNVQVLGGQYRTETLNIPQDRLALLQADVDAAEAETIRQIMNVTTPTRYFDGPMGLPAAAAITSPFGSTRSYNGGTLLRLHTGTDFAGAPGVPIYAPAAGVVVFSGLLDVRGNATIVDHGWGVFTGYWHQTESYVQVGAQVTPGQVIGTVGSSGRVTGPHLHWELWVNGHPVDPMQWVEMAFR